jgi:hypothetical protein
MAVFLSVMSSVLVAIAAQAGPTVLKEVPKEGDIPYGKVILVDDGTCPKGEVKEVTGGSRAKAIPRKTRCVKRPAKAE